MVTRADYPTASARAISTLVTRWLQPSGIPDGRCNVRPIESDDLDAFRPVHAEGLELVFPAALVSQPVLGVDASTLAPLFFTPLAIRLNYVTQLSTTCLRVNLDAKHCRLSHALGTLAVFSSLSAAALAKEHPQLCAPKKPEVIAAFFYASLHDCFQGPFGHVLDSLREHLVGAHYHGRRLDKSFLAMMCEGALNVEAHPGAPTAEPFRCFREVVGQRATKLGVDTAWILRWILRLAVPEVARPTPNEERRSKQIGWFLDLLEGPIDADRWDYLWRDTRHLGLREHRQVAELLGRLREDLTIVWDGERSFLAVSPRTADRLTAEFFPLRRKLYQCVYESPEKRLIDALLNRVILLRVFGLDFPARRNSTLREDAMGAQRELAEFVLCTDTDLLQALAAPPDNALESYLSAVAHELGSYPSLEILWQRRLSLADQRRIVRAMAEKVKVFEYTRGAVPHFEVPPMPGGSSEDDLRERLGEVMRKMKAPGAYSPPLGAEEMVSQSLLLHFNILPIRIRRLLQFERVAWILTVEALDGSGSSIVTKMCAALGDVLTRAGYDAGFEQRDLAYIARVCPPIYVSFPWIEDLSEDSAQTWSRSASGSQVWVGTRRNGSSRSLQAEAAVGDREGSVALAGIPLTLINGLDEEEVQQLKYVCQHAITSLLTTGACLAVPEQCLGEGYDYIIQRFVSDRYPATTRVEANGN